MNGEHVRLTDYVPKRRSRYAQHYGWTSTHDFPTGRLCLQAYSPYPRADWTQQWRETTARDLSGRVSAIVRELEKATVEIARLVEEGERQAKRLEEFFADAERRAQHLPDDQRECTIERLRRARALIGSTHPLERFDAWRAPEER